MALGRLVARVLLCTSLYGILSSCGKVQETDPRIPIAFKAEAGTQADTKAPGTLLSSFSVNTFTLFGTSTEADGTTSTVFDGYTVRYDGGWFYKGIGSQELQYWDKYASGYSFSAVAGGTADGGTATFTEATAGDRNFVALEKDNQVEPSDFGKVVDLQFSRLLSRVRFAFYEEMAEWQVKDISFTLNGTVVTKGDYSVDLADGSFSVSNISSESALDGSVHGILGNTVATAKAGSFTEVLPYRHTAPMTLTIHSYTFVDPVNGNEYPFSPETEVTIPTDKSAWDLNHSYTYVLKVSEAEVQFALSIDLSIHDWMNISHDTVLE